jgi:hypothetical protein
MQNDALNDALNDAGGKKPPLGGGFFVKGYCCLTTTIFS